MTPDQQLAYMQEYTNKNCARVFFKDTTMTAWAKEAIDDLGGARKWSYSHLLRGFQAAVAPEVTNATPVLDTDDAIRMWAFARYCLKG